MKRIFMIAVGLLIAIILVLVGFGAFLNYRDENNIARRMSSRVLRLHGVKAEVRELSGRFVKESLRLSAENMTDAVSRMEGTIAEVYVAPNQLVKQGQPICRIVSEDIEMRLAQADVNIARAEAVRVRYENAYGRYRRLVDMDAVSKEQYDDVVANYKSATAEVEMLRIEKRQYEILKDRLTVTAPIDGEVLMLYKKAGGFLQAGASVALIGNFNKLNFKESVSDADFQRLGGYNNAWNVRFSKNDLDKIYSGKFGVENKGYTESFTARIKKIDPPLAAEASLRSVQWEIDNTAGLLEPKRYQNVMFEEQESRRVLAVPVAAFVNDERNSVFVHEQGVLKLRAVESGIMDGKYCEISGGLEPGDIVVVSGKEGLTDGTKAEVTLEEVEPVGN